MAEAYFGLRRTRKRTHPVRCTCCNSADEAEHHANDEKKEKAISSDGSHVQPKRSRRIISKKAKARNRNTAIEKAKACGINSDNESEKNSNAFGSHSSSRQNSPAREKPTRNRTDKTKKSVSVNKSSKAKLSCQELEEKLNKNTDGKTSDQLQMNRKGGKRKETVTKPKILNKGNFRSFFSQKEGKVPCNPPDAIDKPLVSLCSRVKEDAAEKKCKNSFSKKSSGTSDNVTEKDVSVTELSSRRKRKQSEKESSSSTKNGHKKLVAANECLEGFDDSDDLPLSVAKATVLETEKSSRRTARDTKVSISGVNTSTHEEGTRKIKVSYNNFDEVSRNKLEAFDHIFHELKKCPGNSKLTIPSAISMLMTVDKEQLKLIFKPKQICREKKGSSVSISSAPRENVQLSPPIKKKRSRSSNSEDSDSRSKNTVKSQTSKGGGSDSLQKIDDKVQKGQEMNECQAAEALLNFKSKPAMSRSDSITTSDSNVSSKDGVIEAKTGKNAPQTSVVADDIEVSSSSPNVTTVMASLTNSTAEALLQIQTTAAEMSLPSTIVAESSQGHTQIPSQISGTPKVLASQTSNVPTPQPIGTNVDGGGEETVESDKANENSVAITDQVAKAIDSLAHIFDQNQRQFPGFPLQTVLPQSPGFNPVTWAQTIPASIGQFGNVSANLSSNVRHLAPQALNPVTPQAFNQMASHVFSQVMSQEKQPLLSSSVQSVLPAVTSSAQQALLSTVGHLGLAAQQSSQATPMPITETQPKQNSQPVTQPKSQLPLKSMEEIVGNVGQSAIPPAVGWSFPKSQAPVVYLASPQTLGAVPRSIVPTAQGTVGVHLGHESIYKPVSSKATTAKPDIAPAPGLSRMIQGGTLQSGLNTMGKRPILPREQGTSGNVQAEIIAAHRLPPVVSLSTNKIPSSMQTHVSTPNPVPSQQKAVSANTTFTTTVSAKQAVKKLVRERTKSAELKRQDSLGSVSGRPSESAGHGQRLESVMNQQSASQPFIQTPTSGDGVITTVDISALQQPKYQNTRPNEFNVEQAASALLSIGKTESPEGNVTSQRDENQDGQDEKVVFTSKGMFRVGDVEVDPQYNRIGREGYTCGKCGKIFTSLNYLARHIKRVCPDMSCRKWKCNQCDKAFRHPFGLQQHVYTHTGERPHKCSQCPKAFYSSNDLRRHSRIHSGERPYKCKHCEKSFATTISLKTHTYIHTGEKPHKCPHCPKTFATSSKLGRHIVTHSEQRPFSCQQCPKSFNRSGDLRRHSLHVHESNEKPFECDECNKPFATSVCLKIHKNMHKVAQTSAESEKPFKCSTCDKTYDSATQLEKHHLTHVPSAPLGYNYKQFHPIAPKPSGNVDETGNAENKDTKLSS